MAAGEGTRLPVNCGVLLSGKQFILNYSVGKEVDKKSIHWDWHDQGGFYVAKLEAKTKNGDVKYHNSAPIDSETHSKLGTPKKSYDDGFYKVKLKKLEPDVKSLEQFFKTSQY